MTTTAPALTPGSVPELVDAVRSTRRVIAIGAGTKPRLAQVGDEFSRISMTKLAGIIDYEPSEFTFTALAGTPVKTIVAELSQSGQYLPFDPLLADAGATLGGTVASGLSGPGRFRFGGLRDFILGVRFVDGDGRLLRLGGRVVKNAAGFDVPKITRWSHEIHERLLAAILRSNSWLCIFMITDLFGGTQRFNIPGAISAANWSERLDLPASVWNEDPPRHEKLIRIRDLLRGTGRLGPASSVPA